MMSFGSAKWVSFIRACSMTAWSLASSFTAAHDTFRHRRATCKQLSNWKRTAGRSRSKQQFSLVPTEQVHVSLVTSGSKKTRNGSLGTKKYFGSDRHANLACIVF